MSAHAVIYGLGEICALTGNWEVYDPADPPHLLGQLWTPGDPDGLSGTFDAVYCMYAPIFPD